MAADAAVPIKKKTSLCLFYLQGECEKGDECTFAHGTKDLTGDTGGGGGKPEYKTVICKKFLQFGQCDYGASCQYAHGIMELNAAARASDLLKKDNPLFKTTICKEWQMTRFCLKGRNCAYAHGKHELRERPDLDVNNLSAEMKKKLIASAERKPDYKTAMCNNFEKEGECEFGELCRFAHGQDELREYSFENDPKSIFYKTTMCKNFEEGTCEFGEKCRYAHSPAELREPPPEMKKPRHSNDPWDIASRMQMATMYNGHYQPDRSNPAQNPQYKTTMCKSVGEDTECSYGDTCNFAHSKDELREAPPPPMMPDPTKPANYKTMLCEKFKNGDECTYGDHCNYAHGQHELRSAAAVAAAAARSPARAMLCRYGPRCMNRVNCAFAHSEYERMSSGPASGGFPGGFPGFMPTFSGMGGPAAAGLRGGGRQPPGMTHGQGGVGGFKSEICHDWKLTGLCPRMTVCQFAHGTGELRRPQPKAKMQLCPTWKMQGFCPEGDGCGFAHGMGELNGRSGAAPPPPPGTHASAAAGGPQAQPTYAAAAGNYKTMLCNSYKEKKPCKFGSSCMYAHGPHELRAAGGAGDSSLGGGMGMLGDSSLSSNFKTAMCRDVVAGKACPRGQACPFAHSAAEMTPKRKAFEPLGGPQAKRFQMHY